MCLLRERIRGYDGGCARGYDCSNSGVDGYDPDPHGG
jgi:hypothetical protein